MRFKFNFIWISQKGRDFRLMSLSFPVLLSLWMHIGRKSRTLWFCQFSHKTETIPDPENKTLQENQEEVAVPKHMIEHNCSSHAHLEAHSLREADWRPGRRNWLKIGRGQPQQLKHLNSNITCRLKVTHKGKNDTLWKTHQANLRWYFTSKNINWQLLTITWLCQYQASFFWLFSTHLNANYLTLSWALHKDLAVKMSNPAQQLAGKQLSKAPSDTFSAIFDHCWRPHLKKETLQGRFPYGWVE